MEFLVKLLLTNLVILSCVRIGKTMPTLGGLIATMPITSLLVMLWLYRDSRGDTLLLGRYTSGVLLGIGPTILFFLAVWFCLRRGVPFGLALSAGMAAWGAGAAVHQLLLR
jgi:uncharacterized membrane protein (GlpM family)